MLPIEAAALEKSRANHRTRNACTGHLFEPVGHHGQYRCRYCGATADSRFVEGYLQGIAHSKPTEGLVPRTNWVTSTRKGR